MIARGKRTTINGMGILFLCLFTGGLYGTYVQAETINNSTASDFSWLAGRWVGKPSQLEAGRKDREKPLDPTAEEIWSSPKEGVVMGMFRLVDGSKTLVLEFMSLRDTPTGVEMTVRHFTPALEAWEEDPILLRLVSYDGNEAHFDNPIHGRPKRSILKRIGENSLTLRSEVIGENGQTAIIEVPMIRVSDSPSSNSSPSNPRSEKNAIMDSLRFLYEDARRNTLKSAEIMPEEEYEFKPATGVRSFREILGHMIDAQNLFCAAAAGKPTPDDTRSAEKNRKTKSLMLDAAQESFDYCDKLYQETTDRELGDKILLGEREETRALPLVLNIYHLSRHYGNIVAYFRLKGLIPPSSQR